MIPDKQLHNLPNTAKTLTQMIKRVQQRKFRRMIFELERIVTELKEELEGGEPDGNDPDNKHQGHNK